MKALPGESRRNIAALNETYGMELLMALSEFHQNEIAPMVAEVKKYQQESVIPFLKSDSHGLAGAAATAMESRFMGFAKASVKYQQALEKLNAAYKGKVRGIELVKLEQTVTSLNRDLNIKFETELNKYMGNAKASRRGTVWSNSERAKHLAKSARTTQPIDLSSTRSFELVKRFEKLANFSGKNLIILDAGFRGIDVFKDFAAGEDWQRSAVMQTTGFGFGTAAGVAAGTAITKAAIGITLLGTPLGWFFVLGVGLAVGFGVAKIVDTLSQGIAGGIYDFSSNFRGF
ncbi:hypothetical protein [Thalassomonas haliotis]|uniref:Channel forming colicins domain-containing protein n=1 Tax=Thalassomonas haliotis TaxID=485448 RepID=A0ABY7VJ48_9GAMM|nr:hypothetical protein [Thalassomonas haliotis]WDE13503.1 hypothetical protein H3N35_08735 [Thalassomonas haliotis]